MASTRHRRRPTPHCSQKTPGDHFARAPGIQKRTRADSKDVWRRVDARTRKRNCGGQNWHQLSHTSLHCSGSGSSTRPNREHAQNSAGRIRQTKAVGLPVGVPTGHVGSSMSRGGNNMRFVREHRCLLLDWNPVPQPVYSKHALSRTSRRSLGWCPTRWSA
jgi:hypothetical protein